MPILKDNRRYLRAPVDWPAVMLKTGGASEVDLTDISLGGAFIRSAIRGIHIRSSSSAFVVPNRRTLKVFFEVVWLRVDCSANNIPPCGMGIRFYRVSRTDRHFLHSFLASD